ncbi:amino acid permease, partial [Acinetobacter baumannii]
MPGEWNDTHKALLSCGAIVLFYIINLMGLKMSSLAQNILMIIKITMILVLLAALFFPDKYAQHTVVQAANQSINTMDWIKSLGISLV